MQYMEFYFSSFVVWNEGQRMLFPAGYYKERDVFTLDGDPYPHPFVYSSGAADLDRYERIEDILLCKPNRVPVFPYENFTEDI